MNTINLFKIAIKAIAANKMRSFLTALGIIIGVAAVIAMLAIGQGSKRSIKANISEMGSNMIMIQPGADNGPGGVRQDASAMQSLKIADYEAIAEQAKYISAVSPTVNTSGQFVYGNNNTPSSVYGVSPDYLTIRQLKIEDGEMFTEQDIKTSAKVCVLGKTIVDYLFPDGSSPIGRIIRIKNIPFRVVGVLKSKGTNSMGMDQDNLALAPYTTVMKRVNAQTYLGGINCSALTEEITQQAISDITDILRRTHKLKDATEETEGDDNDFTIRSQEEISRMMSTTMDSITMLLGIVAGISLLVGGIGIMNIMLASVTERTREIGIRRAIGAKRFQIVLQFLIEALALSVIGGMIGMALGLAIPFSVTLIAGMPTVVTPMSLVLSFGISVGVGICFGIYPAVRASKLDPIVALRYE